VPAALLDTSVWLAAVFPTHPLQTPAREYLQRASAAEPAVFCRATPQSFLRLASTPALLKAYGAIGLTNRDAVAALAVLMTLPQVCEREEPRGCFALWQQLATRDTASPKVWMDAYLTAFAICGGWRLVSPDRDLKDFLPAVGIRR